MFWKKIEDMLQEEFKKKTYKLEASECVYFIDSLARRNYSNSDLWKPILTDIEASLQFGCLTNTDIYVLLRSLYAVKLVEADAVKQLVEYIVKRGYDSDDLLKMGTNHRKAVHFIWLVADSCPKLKNKHFMTHIAVFV